MADNSSKHRQIPRDDVPREQAEERKEIVGPLDVPQEETGEDFQNVEDSMLARPTIPVRHIVTDNADEAQPSAPAPDALVRPEGVPVGTVRKSKSLLQRRLERFKGLRRGYYSFIILGILYIVSFALPLLVNNKALIVRYNGETYFPTWQFITGETFGQKGAFPGAEANYRKLDQQFESAGGDNWVLMPPYTWNPLESDFEEAGAHPKAPSSRHLLGTDDAARDVFARMCYGFNISLSFALLLTVINYAIGATLGGLMGYYGGKFDLFAQRGLEIWANVPFLYTVIIISSLISPNFLILVGILALFGWIGISYYMRGEFLREKNKDYVAAAISLGAGDRQIIFQHILPNSLTPLIAYLPFQIILGISALVSLDYLGFGLPPPTPSWGQMVEIGLQNKEHWWLVTTPLVAMFTTLLLVTFIGEAIREALDPRVFSRLR